MVAGWIIGLSRTIGWRRAISALRPWSGLLIMVAVSIWWPLLVLGTVDDAWSIWNRETIERIAGDDGASGSRLDPYYLYRTPVLIAPWLLIWPLILFWPCFAGRAPRGRGSVRVLHALWWTIVFTMILLSFSAGRRWYYLLPLLAPLCVLAADAAIQFVEGVIRRGAIRSAVLLALGPALLMVLAAAAMMAARSSSGMASVETALALLSAGGALVWLIARIVRATPHPGECASDFARRLLVSAALAVAIVLPGASSTLALWRDRRAEGRDFALAVGQLVPRDAALIGFGGPWDEVRYNLHRTVPCVQDRGRGLAPIGHLLRDSYFLLIEEGIPLPAEAADATRVLAMPRDGEAERLQLWRVDGTATRTQGESRQGG